MSVQAWSFAPEAFVAAGMLSNCDVEITDARFHIWNYPGKDDTRQVFLKLTMNVLEAGQVSREAEQNLSAARLGFGEISEDEFHIIPAEKTAPSANTNMHRFFVTLFAAGMPQNWLADGDVSKLVGIRCHVDSIKRTKTSADDLGGNEFVCTEIHAGPWDKKSGTAGAKTGSKATAAKPAPAKATAAAGAGAAAAAAAASTNGAGDEESLGSALEILTEYLTSNGPVKVALLFPTLTKAAKDNPAWATASKHFKAGALEGLLEFSGGALVKDSGMVKLAE